MLFDAYELFLNGNSKSDEIVRDLGENLWDAINDCIDAATCVYDISTQKKLLKAAVFGKSYASEFPNDRISNVCSLLRAINQARTSMVGVCITYRQLSDIGVETLISNLMQLRHYHLAFCICENIRPSMIDQVLLDWAQHRMMSSNEHQSIARDIVDKVEQCGLKSFSLISRAAYQRGLVKLASELLKCEKNSAKQVPLLLKMQEDERALLCSTESGDPDLVYLTIIHLRQKLNITEFFKILTDRAVIPLLESYCKKLDPELLRKFYFQDDRKYQNALLFLNESFAEIESSPKVEKLSKAAEAVSYDRTHGLESRILNEQLKLISMQIKLENELKMPFFGLSAGETMRKCLREGHISKSEKIKSDFSFSEQRYWWTKVNFLVATRKFTELEELAFSKKSPVGYRVYIFNL